MESENLKKKLMCALCNDTLIEPKLVDCFHVFCKLCVKRNAEADQQDCIFKCPQCDSTTLLQDLNDVEDLQNSPIHSRILKVLELLENQKICSMSSSHPEALWQCVDCNKSLCEECLRCHSAFVTNHQVVSLSDLKNEDIDKLLKKEAVCKIHGNENVELYCQECDILICLHCLKEHRNHNTKALQDIIAIETDVLSKKLAEIKKMTADDKVKKEEKEIALMMKRDAEKAKQQVKELTDKLVKTLRNNEQQLLNKLQESITNAERNLRIITHPSQVQEYINYFLENGTASEMIESRHDKSSQNFTYNSFDKTIGGIEFKPNEELCEQVKHGFGLVRSIEKPDPKMSSIKVVPSDPEAMKKAKLVVELKTSEGEVTQVPLQNIAIQFTPADNVKVEEIQMTDDSEITVDVIPRVPGQLTAGITLHGNPVCNSPLVMLVKPKKIWEMTRHSKFKNALNTVGSKKFVGIAVNQTKSKIAVADLTSHCVRVFSMEGNLLLTYGSEGGGQRQLKYPYGLAFLNERDLVIADRDYHRICIVNTVTGQLVRAFGRKGNANGQFVCPWGVHVDDDENILVCDCDNHRVQIFTKDGGYLRQFSVPGCPRSVVARNGMFYVSSDSVVHVMEMKDDQSFSTVTRIGGNDYTDGQLQNPRGLAIDNDNNLLVCDDCARLIYMYTLDGRYVGQSDQLANGPRYIAVLNDGQVICTTTKGGGVVFLAQGEREYPCNFVVLGVGRKEYWEST